MDIIDINISNNKYSNVDVTNKTKINNFNLGNYDNIIYINSIRSETNNLLTLNKSNSTYVIRDYNTNIYKKYITEIKKSNKDTFVSYNHNLKKNDIINLYNINRSDINLLKSNLQNTDITYKVLNVTRNTFTLVSFNNSNNNFNNITDIVVTSYNNITNGYFVLESTKSSVEVLSKVLNVNIKNNTEDDYGVFYNLVIDSDINELTINTINNDKLSGYILFNNEEIIGPDYLETVDNKSTLNIKNMPFTKGDKNINILGRPKETKNKLYATRRYIFNLLEDNRDKLEREMESLKGKDFVSHYIKLLGFLIAPRNSQVIDISKLSIFT